LHPHFFDEFLVDLNFDSHSTMFVDSDLALAGYNDYSADGGVPDAGAASGIESDGLEYIGDPPRLFHGPSHRPRGISSNCEFWW
jgi:hypothetical protein